MFDILTTLHVATCAHCGGPIHFANGDLSGGAWYHDETGQKPCPGTPTAFPIESTIRDWTTPAADEGGA